MNIPGFPVITLMILVLALAGTVMAQPADSAAAPPADPAAVPAKPGLETELQRISYAIGLQMGGTLMQNKIEVNADAVIAGLSDKLNGRESAMTEEELKTTMEAFQAKMQETRMAEMREREAEATANLEKANAYLAENAGKPGVVKTDSGLQYTIEKQGEGPKPTAESKVRVHYRGTLIDGTQFDSSIDRGEPATFGVNQVIPGWTEALQLMNVGSKYKLVIPPDLAYGAKGNQRIPGNSVLLFDVELLEILPDTPQVEVQ